MKRLRLIIILFAVSCFALHGQTRKSQLISFDFVDQHIREILYAFSTYAGISIIGDDTVTGSASFQYNGANFEQAFDSFLLTSRLFVEKTENVWIVSRIKISTNYGGIILDSLDATASQLTDKLSRKTNATILRDILPETRLSMHLETVNPQEAVELYMKPFSDYTVETAENYIHIKKANTTPFGSFSLAGASSVSINENSGFFDVDIERAGTSEALNRLFQAAGREYLSFIRPDQMIERIKLKGRGFYETLRIILEQGGGEYKEIGDMFYIFPLQQAEIIASLKNEGKTWQSFEVLYHRPSEILPLIHSRFTGMQTASLPGSNTFLAYAGEETAKDIRSYIAAIDLPRHREAIRLKYIRTEDLYKFLPPSAQPEDLVDAGNGNTFFFLGSDERKEMFL
jgi:type II secretory pathway component GspD/PulD (secretin)